MCGADALDTRTVQQEEEEQAQPTAAEASELLPCLVGPQRTAMPPHEAPTRGRLPPCVVPPCSGIKASAKRSSLAASLSAPWWVRARGNRSKARRGSSQAERSLASRVL